MEKKSYISSMQVVFILFITRLLFSTSYQSVFNAGNSIQDILLSLPVNLITNFIIAIPLLILLSRNPGHDPVECAAKAAGRSVGTIIAVFYYLFFIICAAGMTGNFENYFTAAVIPDVNAYIIGLLILLVCVYGAVKGIEAIARFGSVVAVLYIVAFIVIFLTIMPQINLDLLKPLLYKGTTYFMSGSLMNYNLSIQIILLAFLAPFLRPGASISKTYAGWNLLSVIVLFVLEFTVITVTGAYGSKQIYPLQSLATLSHISAFERLDAIDMVSWILNAAISITIYIYLAVSCLLKAGLNKHRRLLAFISGLIVFFAATYIARNISNLQSAICSAAMSFAVTAFTVAIPLIILIADLVKGRMMQNAQEQ